MPSQTIFALASGRPPAALGIIRISGPLAHRAGSAITGELPAAKTAALRSFRHPGTGELIDQGLVLPFAGPASSTGEDLVELHCHGSRAVVDALIDALSSIQGLRLAQPGEFTRRAFENGRIDLTEAEGLADLLEAETEAQRKAALAMAEGGLRRQIESWQQALLQLSARAEVAIDYAEEGDFEAEEMLYRDCDAIAKELDRWLRQPLVEPLKDGIKVVVAGPPNAGKSSLVNRISGSDRAIVTDIPGTTRDHIEVPLALDGIPLLLTDTAGLRETEEAVERIGVERSRALLERADILLWLGDPGEAPPHPRRILVHSKADLAERAMVTTDSIAVSSQSGVGVDALLRRVGQLVREILPFDDALALNRRQAALLAEARDALRSGTSAGELVILAEALRSARAAFDRLTGRAGVEDVLDALFGRFCLGK